MEIQFGNVAPKHQLYDEAAESLSKGAAVVTTVQMPDEYLDSSGITSHYGYDPDVDVSAFRSHVLECHSPYLEDGKFGVTNATEKLGHYNEALMTVVHPSGIWTAHSRKDPTWVWCDDEAFGKVLSDFYQIPQGFPGNFTDTHWRVQGRRLWKPGDAPNVMPGDIPGSIADLDATIVDTGRLAFQTLMGGGKVGLTGAGTTSSTTTLSISSLTASAWIGYRIYVYSTSTGMTWGNIVSNTTSAVTVDQWYVPGTPGGAAATAPTTPWAFVIADGGVPSAWFAGLSTTNTATVHTDTSMSGEIIVGSPTGEASGGGLLRKLQTFTSTSAISTSTYTESATWTVNANDGPPLPNGAGTGDTIYRVGYFSSAIASVSSIFMMFESLMSAPALLVLTGDALTATDTITGS